MAAESVRVLVLEDDSVMRETLRETLEEEGYDVCAVGSGVEAIEQARSGPFDLIVADVRMEGIDGLTAIEHLQELTPGIRSLVVSGYCDEADTLRALRLGVGDFIRKPFELQDLLDAVRRQAVQKKAEARKQADREAFTTALLLALEAMARVVDLQQGGAARFARTGGLELSGRWAEAVALGQGLDARTARSCSLLCLWWAVSRLRPDPRLGQLEAALPDSPATVLRELRDQRPSSSVARLVVAVLRFAELGESDLEGLVAAGVDPRLVEALGRVEESGLESAELMRRTQQQGQQRRGLLALAAALESKRDLDGAEQAFTAVLPAEGVSPEQVEAELGLARLRLVRGDRQALLEHCRRAVESASRLGPNTLAVTRSQAAILAYGSDPDWSVQMLTAACQSLELVGRSVDLARARLGLWVGEPGGLAPELLAESLRELTQPVYSDELALCANWLAPALLERCARLPEAAQALFQIARLFPGEYRGLLRRGRLSAAARANLVPILTRAATDGARQVLEVMATEQDPAGLAAWKAAQPAEAEGSSLIRLYTLGGFTVYRGEHRIPDRAWKRIKNRLFFARLASASGPVAEDLLIEELWPGDLDKGRQNIYSATSAVRRCLTGEDGARLEVVSRSGLGLSLAQDVPLWHDLSEVRDGLQAAARCQAAGQQQQAYERLKRVHKLYRGPYLEGCYLDWAVAIRHQLENEILTCFGKLCLWLEQQSRGEELGEFARWMLGVDSCSQQAHIYLMRSLLLTDRPEEAVRHFERARSQLAQELAMEPSIDLLREHQKALLSLP